LDHERSTRRFYDLVWPHRADILRLARILTNSAAEADDLAQETLLKSFRAIEQFREGTDALAWLTTILRHARIDRLRSAAGAQRQVSLDDLGGDVADAAGETEPAADWHNPQEILNAFGDQDIIDALQELPEEIRWTLLLVDVQGQQQQDAAQVLGIPVGTVKSRLHRGRAMLRRALAPRARQMRPVQ
jgi:RNA polymerase sigma-70 factor (ECF subfamily)